MTTFSAPSLPYQIPLNSSR